MLDEESKYSKQWSDAYFFDKRRKRRKIKILKILKKCQTSMLITG